MSNDFELIKQRLSVVDVISRYINTTPNGQNYKAVCPFHKEKNPSLVISEQKQIWHCFGCGAGGDIFRFVEQYENIPKKDALVILAQMANYELTKISNNKENNSETIPEDQSEFLKGQKYLNWGAGFFHSILLKIIQNNDHPVTKYCLSRGLTSEIIKKFQIGYSLKDDFLYKIATENNLNQELLIAVGLLKKTDYGSTKDKFSDRIMIPVFDKIGKVVGFTARNLPEDTNPNRPKYLNSSQSKWFNKSSIWYGWNLNSQSIRRLNKVIIVEGNMDVIKAYQFGLDYALASQGTSFTGEQLRMLKSLTKNIHLAFDNDQAGIIAAFKFFLEATRQGFVVQKLIIEPQFKDLDEKLSSESGSKLKTEYFLEYYIKSNINDLTGADLALQKSSILKVMELVSVCDEITKEQYINNLSKVTKISTQTLSKYNTQNSSLINNNDGFAQFGNKFVKSSNDKVIISLKEALAIVDVNDTKIGLVFEILRYLIPKLCEYESILAYYEYVKPELELMKENNKAATDNSELYFSKLTSYIDQHISKILFSEKSKETYLKLKSIV